ncbi:hypothetical protein [Pseudomonas umsongensis]|uniref:Uncharacterized protein n=1 Tax=Pseudomonas umsongensis TaxID=198618 RepID=A0AAE6ZTA1_9PSED|nr:hypothetical protein [Pseudomonas umsongensis]QJC78920.1 hypothetical protein HGP31_11565 [Pseudomonas umsongensis]
MIRRPDGSTVSINTEHGRHTGEVAAARQEITRLPHGELECKAAQFAIFA